MSENYPWIRDSKIVDNNNIGYLRITAPNGLYSHKIKYNDNIVILDDVDGIKLTTGVNKGLYLNSERITPGSGAAGVIKYLIYENETVHFKREDAS